MIEIVSLELIKPSSSTPQPLRRLNFSMLDQLSPSNYVPMAFYYPAPVPEADFSTKMMTMMSVQRLRTSLSDILTMFYPLAGRINGNDWIECDDQGAVFVVARSLCPLSRFLVPGSEPESARRVLPIGLENNQEFRGCPLIIQVTSFPCGGMAISVRVCHKICDASSRTAFINAWAALSRGDETAPSTAPIFIGTKLFPPSLSPPLPPTKTTNNNNNHHHQPGVAITSPSPALELKRDQSLVTKKYTFSASSIAALKAKAASERVPKPSRVEALTALIWKCAMKAKRKSSLNIQRTNPSSTTTSVMTQAVNLRKRFDPPLPDSLIGNVFLCYAPTYPMAYNEEESLPDLKELVCILRLELTQLCDKFMERIRSGKEDEVRNAIAESFRGIEEITGKDGAEVYRFTSWCGFPIYGADFGSGSPECVGIATSPFKNVGVLMDAKDGCGVEAWVCLSAQDMESFHTDEELLASLSTP